MHRRTAVVAGIAGVAISVLAPGVLARLCGPRFCGRRLLATRPARATASECKGDSTPSTVLHLNAAGASPMPTEARDAMVGYLEYEVEVGAYTAQKKRPHAAREALATLLRCDVEEVALLDSAQAAWARAFYSLNFTSSADRILCFASEYAGNAVAYLQMARRTGARIEVLPMRTDGIADVPALEAALQRTTTSERAERPGRTLVALTHIQTSESIVQPAAAVGALCERYGAVFLLDTCQSVGQLPVDVRALGCDFACGTGRKWLRAPRGTGFLYVRRRALDEATRSGSTSLFGEPPLIDHSGAVWSTPDSYTLLPDAKRFEMWEADEAARHGLEAAAVVCRATGPARNFAHATRLAARLRSGLAAIPGCVIRDAPPSFDEEVARSLGAARCAIVTFEAESTLGVRSADLHSALEARGISVSVSPSTHHFEPAARARPSVVRISPSYINAESEIDTALAAIAEELARLAREKGA